MTANGPPSPKRGRLSLRSVTMASLRGKSARQNAYVADLADSLEKVKAELSSTVESQKTELNKLRKRTEELASENDDLKLVGVKLNADLVSVRAVASS